MTAPSRLRQLARDYFEGRLEREDYRQQRKLMIDAWVAGPDSSDTSTVEHGPEVGAPLVPGYGRADGDTLENAFANRNLQAGLAEPAHSPPSLIPDFSGLPGEGSNGANKNAPAPVRAAPSRSDRLGRYLLWLVPVLVLSAALPVLLYISR